MVNVVEVVSAQPPIQLEAGGATLLPLDRPTAKGIILGLFTVFGRLVFVEGLLGAAEEQPEVREAADRLAAPQHPFVELGVADPQVGRSSLLDNSRVANHAL